MKREKFLELLIPFSASINDDGGNALQPSDSSTEFDISLSLDDLTVDFTCEES